MNNAINCSGFVEMYLKSDDDFEPYGYSEADARLETNLNTAQLNIAGYTEFTDD